MRVIIIGCGLVGAGVAQNLSQRGHAVTVVDKDPAAFERLGSTFKGRCVEGVGFDRDVLLKAGIERADGLAAVTGSDETNVVAATVARRFFSVPKVIVRLYDPRQAEIYHRQGLETIAPTTWGINRIADWLSYSRLDNVFSLGSGELDMVEAEIPPLLVGRTVKELTIPNEVTVVAIVRGDKAFLPGIGAVFQAGDVVYLAAMNTATDRLNTLLGLA